MPLYNEEESLKSLFNDIEVVDWPVHQELEFIFVDDGSSDSSSKVLHTLQKEDDRIKIFAFNKNRGQHKALMFGVGKAQGDIIITMDADLQNNPKDIPKLLLKLDEGFDVVCTWRFCRKDPLVRSFKSRIGNYIQRKITGINIHDMGCSLRVYRAKAIKSLKTLRRYEIGMIPYFIFKNGYSLAEIKVEHRHRIFGKSKYKNISHAIGVVLAYMRVLSREYVG